MAQNLYRSSLKSTTRSYLESSEMDALHEPQHHQYIPINPTSTAMATKGHRPPGSWFTWWRLELLTSLVATGSMVAIVGILIAFDNSPLTSWPYSRFSLNSVIALLATIARTSLMFPVTASIGQRKWRWFLPKRTQRGVVSDGSPARLFRDFEAFDDSSRSWLGSLKFLGKIGFRDLAFMGAAIIVLALLFNTLVQNLVITVVRTKEGGRFGERAGAIVRSTNYDQYLPGSTNTAGAPDLSTLAAMYEGMLSSNVSEIPVSCPTGNCTWPINPTVGVCGSCMDVSSSLLHSCTNASSCKWSIPGGATLTNPASAPGTSSIALTTVFAVDAGPNKIWNASNINQDKTQWIQDFNVIGLSFNQYNVTTYPTPIDLPGVRAYECGMWFCLQARHTKVSFGSTNQSITATWYQVASQGSDPSPTGTADFTDIPRAFNTESDVVYSVSNRAEQAAALGIESMLYGLVSPDNPGEISYLGSQEGSVDGLKGLWYAADDMDGWMGNLTRSMSNNVRLTGTPQQHNSTLYDGVAWAEETYIQVQWLWIIFPWALVLMSITFLIITIVETRHHKPWKNSTSTVLYTRLDDPLQEAAYRAGAQNRSLTEDFDRTTVRLDTANWTFRPVSMGNGWTWSEQTPPVS